MINNLLNECHGKIKVLALTGIRSEYDLMHPLLKALDCDESFEVGVIVSGAHLTPLHHYSVSQIELDGFRIAERIENYVNSDSRSAKVFSIGSLIQSLSMTLNREKPDLLIVLGDREEVIAGSMAAAYMSIPTIHIAAGDATWAADGDVDEEVRFAASKLSHVFLTMANEHKDRLIKLGEQSWRIMNVGNGGLDRILSVSHLSKAELADVINGLVLSKYAVCIYHPLSSYSSEEIESEVENAIETALSAGLKVLLGNPNSDPGYDSVIKVFDRYTDNPNVFRYGHLERTAFINLLRHASLLIGNSSLGVHEAGFLALPALNIGERQQGRLTDNNIVFVENNIEKLREATTKLLSDKFKSTLIEHHSIYGDGTMAQKSLAFLKSLPSKKVLLAKQITY